MVTQARVVRGNPTYICNLFASVSANNTLSYNSYISALKNTSHPPADTFLFVFFHLNTLPSLPSDNISTLLLAIDSISQENDAILRLLQCLLDSGVLLMELGDGTLELQALGVLVRVGARVMGVFEAVERGLLLPHGALDPEELLLQHHVLVLCGRELALELRDGCVRHLFDVEPGTILIQGGKTTEYGGGCSIMRQR